jgi:L-iditol 2-dehydrogenase
MHMWAEQLVSRRPGQLSLEAVPLPDDLPAGAALVRTESTAISAGTEIAHYLGRTAQRPANSQEPYLPGYCFAGIVERVGPGCDGLQIGQRVTGQLPHASAVITDARQLVRAPDDVSAAEVAMSQLACIALNGVRAASVQLGERVAVVGAGLVGLLAARLAFLGGARGITVVDPIAERGRVAAEFVPGDWLIPSESIARGQRFPVVIEATGAAAAVAPALELAAPGGRVILLGSTRGAVPELDVYATIHRNGLHLIGAHISTTPEVATPHDKWTEAANREVIFELMRGKDLVIEPLCSDVIRPQAAPAMYASLAREPHAHLGVVIDWRGRPA